MKKIVFLLTLSLSFYLTIGRAEAYIDPGTTSMIVGGGLAPYLIVPLLFVIGLFSKFIITPLKKVAIFLWKRLVSLSQNKKVISFLILLLTSIAFYSFKKGYMSQKKLIILGIDAMDPKVTNSLLAQGKLPNFQKLANQGSYKILETSLPPETPVAWTSIATGTNPGKHNIFDFISIDRQTYLPFSALSKSVEKKGVTKYKSLINGQPYWIDASEAGIHTDVMRWPVTFPPQKINGVMLSGLGVPSVKGYLGGYSFYSSEDAHSELNSSKTVEKITVNKDNEVRIEVTGPKISRLGSPVEMKTELLVKIKENGAVLEVNDRSYSIELKHWSPWIKLNFSEFLTKSVSATAKIYIDSLDPFRMYITALQIDPENPVADISFPKNYSRNLSQEIGSFYTLGMPEETSGVRDGFLSRKAFLMQIDELETERDKMFWNLFDQFIKNDQAILSFVYDSSDRLQHMFWDNKVLDGEDDFIVNQEIENYYIRKDKLIGDILKNKDIKLIVLSDHGFTSFERCFELNTWLFENGYIKTIDGKKPVGSLFENVDWKRTTAYSVGFSSLNINLKGRERDGIVDDREKLENELIKKLELLEDRQTGIKPIFKVYKSSQVYSGISIDNAPDLVIGFHEGYRMGWENPIGGFSEKVLYDNKEEWRGDHLVDPSFVPGVLFTNLKLVDDEVVKQVDIYPTIMKFFDLKINSQADGRSLLK